MSLVLEAKNIVKYFHDPADFQVLKNVSLDVKKGEFVSIMGKSGCGKSTLLYILSTMDTDYQGELRLDGELVSGKTVDELAKIRGQKIGFVFQFHYLLPEFSVLHNVMMPAMKLNLKSEEEIRMDALNKLDLLGIKEQADKKSYRLSGGQKQRVAIARALINDPMIIMGDEPTGNLDSKNANVVFEILRELSTTRGQSMIIVTHDPDFAAKTDRIIDMADGEIVK
ncbi:MAG: ABC transporter ATP-binding protein [Flavobacteriales bacterium]|nr:ABC transporter ATP-binding protein [Flavobacteriales bacterium]